MYRQLIKPFFDFVIALISFIVLFPIFILVALILTVSLGGTPFFLQIRPGKNEKLFKIIKFKTMTNKCDTLGNLLPDGERLTGVGKILRATSLDEIPQLLNVIIGDMSLVGPRPLLPEYLELYCVEQKKRHNVKPGITGWAQVKGRNAISWKEKLKLDVWYYENSSFWLDIKILFLTVYKVFKRDGINTEGHYTTEGFNGYN